LFFYGQIHEIKIQGEIFNIKPTFIMVSKKGSKFKLLLAFVLIISLFTSCNNIGKVTIGLLIPAGEGFRWPVDQMYVEKIADERGIEVITRSANNDENLQMKQANELLELGIDVLIVVAVNSNTAAGIVREAHDYGVPVIGYDRLIINSELDYLVTFEGDKIGNLMLNYALDKKPEGNYVMLWGDPGDVNAHLIKEAQEKTIQPFIESGKINLVYKTFVENWSMDNSYHIMKNILSFSTRPIDAVITSYDGLAMGALRAMDEAGYTGNVILTGQDAELPAVKAVSEGRMSLTIYKSIAKIAEASVELAYKLAKKEKITDIKATLNNGRKDVPVLYLDPVAVTKDNIREVLIADKFYTEEQIYGK
jgi:D-xylose transport system substrate-binding protein